MKLRQYGQSTLLRILPRLELSMTKNIAMIAGFIIVWEAPERVSQLGAVRNDTLFQRKPACRE